MIEMVMAREQREVSSEEEAVAGGLRRGPWTVEEDVVLVNYIGAHGEGRWNALARCAGLKRTGKSCRLRWLNYLRPDLRRGDMTAEEQLVILELHARWGNRWSKIAQHLPGRTDNEIKNYWRTRVHRHAKHLNCDVNSQRFKDLIRYLWMPRLLDRIHSNPDTDDSSLLPPAAPDIELSCCTTAVSVSSSSSDAAMPLVSPLPLVAADESSRGRCDDGWYSHINNTAANAMRDGTAYQQEQAHDSLMTQYYQQPAEDQFGAETCWSESLPGLAGLYADVGLPDMEIDGGAGAVLGETMWGAGADELWYTQMLGL